MTQNALATARAYHEAWTHGDFEGAAALLAPALQVEVPVNHYSGPEDFAAAVRSFGSLATSVELVAEASGDDGEAMLLYDMDVAGLGELRVAEHFTVEQRKIVRLRQIHDTAALRAAGFVAETAVGTDGKAEIG